MAGVDRRRFLEVAGGASLAWAGGVQGQVGVPIFPPKVNGGINVHAVRRLDFDPHEREPVIVPELVALQLRAVYELGFDGIRITAPLGDRPGFLAAIPYVRAARALGIDAVVVLSSSPGVQIAQAMRGDRARLRALSLYETVFARPPLPAAPGAGGLGPGGVGRIAFQVLNEPALFFGIPPDVYVREFLRPCYAELRQLNSQIIVVAAAEVGNLAGPPRMRAMLEAGLEETTDRIAYHVYGREVIPLLSSHVRALVWVTESGVDRTALHLGWVRDTFEEIRTRIADVSRIFYFDLYDQARGGFRLIDLQGDATGYRAVAESADLVAYLSRNVAQAAAGAPLIPFGTLVPDVRAYFPNPADVALYDETHPG